MKVLQREEINKISMKVEDIIQQIDPVLPDMLLCDVSKRLNKRS